MNDVMLDLIRQAMLQCPRCGAWFTRAGRRSDVQFCTNRCAKAEMQRRYYGRQKEQRAR